MVDVSDDTEFKKYNGGAVPSGMYEQIFMTIQ
jgi:hypothetical protein